MNVVDKVLKILGPQPGDLEYHLSRNTLEYIFGEDRRQDLDFHDIWMSDTDKAMAEKDDCAWMLSVYQARCEISDPHIQVLAYSAYALIKYVLDPLVETVK